MENDDGEVYRLLSIPLHFHDSTVWNLALDVLHAAQ